MNLNDMKQEVLQYTLQSYGEKLFAGTSGNLSLFDRESGLMAITPSSYPYERMKADDIMVIDLDGNIAEGPHRPSSEWRMHAEIYKSRPDVTAAVHTHSPYATSFAVCGESIPVILIEMVLYLGGDIRTADFAVPGTAEVGKNAIPAMEERGACLLKSHGVIAVGKDLQQAHQNAVYVEDAAKIYRLAGGCKCAFPIPERYVRQMINPWAK